MEASGLPNGLRATIVDVVRSALTSPGDLDPATRRAVLRRAMAVSAGAPDVDPVPEPLAGVADQITRHAHKVVDADIESLGDAGYSEDAIFEALVTTAIGAGVARLMAGLSALDRPAPDHPAPGGPPSRAQADQART